MLTDPIFRSWLEAQHRDARALADASDLLDVDRVDSQLFVARFASKTLVRGVDGQVRETTGFSVGYYFPESFLRRVVSPLEVLTWLGPAEVFHPNAKPPFCCVGPIAPGTTLVELLYRTYDVLTFQNVMPDERDALNPTACEFSRHHQDRFPLDDRPLKRPTRHVRVDPPESTR